MAATLEQVQREFTEVKEKLESENKRCREARARVEELHPQVRKYVVEKEASMVETMETDQKRMEAEEWDWEEKFEKEEEQLINVRERHHNAKREYAEISAKLNFEDAEENLKLEAERKRLDEMVKAHEAVQRKVESTSTKAESLKKRYQMLEFAINGFESGRPDDMLEGYCNEAGEREDAAAQRIEDFQRLVKQFQMEYREELERAERLENEIQDIKANM